MPEASLPQFTSMHVYQTAVGKVDCWYMVTCLQSCSVPSTCIGEFGQKTVPRLTGSLVTQD